MNTVAHTAHFEINQPVDLVFPLFSAEGEKHWVPGWDYEQIMETTDMEEDYIFVTHDHDHGSEPAVWIVKQYEPENYYVSFYKVEANDKVGVITLACTPLARQKSKVSVTYKYTALGDTGEAFLKEFTPDHYETFIREWRRLLLAYFEWEEQEHHDDLKPIRKNENKAV